MAGHGRQCRRRRRAVRSPTPNRSRPRRVCATSPTRAPGIRRKKQGNGFSYLHADGRTISDQASGRASPPSSSRRHGPTCGSARRPTATSRPPGATRAGASSTATTRAGARSGTRKVRPAGRLRRGAARAPQARRRRPRAAGACRARRCWRRWSRLLDDDAHPRRQRGVRRGQRLLRADHAADRPRRGRRARCCCSTSPARAAWSTRSPSRTGGSPASCAQCQELAGQELFIPRRATAVGGRDLDRRERLPPRAPGRDITAKDFRTWGGTAVAAARSRSTGHRSPSGRPSRRCSPPYDVAAEVLGNTRAVCRSCYVHPVVPDAYRAGDLPERVEAGEGRPVRPQRAHDAQAAGVAERLSARTGRPACRQNALRSSGLRLVMRDVRPFPDHDLLVHPVAAGVGEVGPQAGPRGHPRGRGRRRPRPGSTARGRWRRPACPRRRSP